MNRSISGRLPAVVIEYDCRGRRERKTFQDAYAARRFFNAKEREGRHPKVLSAERGESK